MQAAIAAIIFVLLGHGSAFGVSPTVSAVSPNSGTTTGGTSVTITGTGFTGASGVTIGPGGTDWTSRVSIDKPWSGVTYGNGQFVAVSREGVGTANQVLTSPDGITWTGRTAASDNLWNGVTYGNGLFVAVSYSGTGDRVMTSPDGITWTTRTSAADNNWRGITYSNGLFVAVAYSGTGDRVMTSPDGITWTSRTSAADNQWRSVVYGNGLFVAVATSGVGNRVMTSPDGITWTARTSAADNTWNGVTYGNGLFVAVSSTSGIGNKVMTSPDGITWTSQTAASDDSWMGVTYGDGLFVAVAFAGSGGQVMTSPDGINWTSQTSAADNNWKGVTYGNGRFVAVADSGIGDRVMTSGPSAAATDVIVVSDTSITATTPAGSTGPASVLVTTSGGTNAANTLYTYNSSFTIGGSASGLDSGKSVVLQNNAGDNLPVSSNASFTFATAINSGATYAVTVLTQPTGQTCAVGNDTGTANANVTNVSVTCTTNIIDVNDAPTDISFSSNSVNENVAANATVGTLSSTDADAGNTFTYTLVVGTGSTDNASFNISGSSLRITNSPDFETKSSYSVRVRTTDQGNMTFEKAFTISINNLNEAPVASSVSITGTPQVGGQLTGNYSYFDPESDSQGVSTFRWVRNTVTTGVAGGTNISATQNYNTVAGDQGKYLYFCVTLVASAGTTTGTEACSLATAAVAAASANGACGTAVNTPTAFMPTASLCATGSTLNGGVVPGSPWTWTCDGSNGGTPTSCLVATGTTATGTGATWAVISGGGWVIDLVGTTGGLPNTAGTIGTSGNAKSPGSVPTGYEFRHGLYDFTLTGGSGPATVVLTYPSALPAGTVYWKYGKTPTSSTPAWYEFPGAVISNDRLSITLTLTDGLLGDSDASTNGVITDPGGPAAPAAPVATAVTPVPTLSEWGLMLLASLILMAGLVQVRRR